MSSITKVIHRYVRPRSDYMLGGELFTQIIPVNSQAYSYELIENGDPTNPNDYRIYYVLGTGGSTYQEIANGEGVDEDGNLIPELSKEFLVSSSSQINEIINAIIELNCVTYEDAGDHRTINLENNTISITLDNVIYEIFRYDDENKNLTIGSRDIPLNLDSDGGIITINNTETIATEEFVGNNYLSIAEAEADYADKNYVDYAIQTMSAGYITSNVAGEPFATKAALDAATTWYKGGNQVVPAVNDYTIVLADEDHIEEGIAPSTRYICAEVVNNEPVWNYQFTLNSSNFTQAQWDAINSGITSAYITGDGTTVPSISKNASDINDLQTAVNGLSLDFDEHLEDYDNPHRVTAEQIGLGNVNNTSDLDKPISNATQQALNLLSGTLTNHTSNTSIHVTPEDKAEWSGKQAALTEEQLAAVNSGINSEKLAELEDKQDRLKIGNHININNDVISVEDDLSTYNNSVSQFVNKDVDNLTNYYTKEQLEGLYKYSGEVATYDDLPTGNTILNDDYLELEYITADQLQYIDTGYRPTNQTKVSITFKLLSGLDNCLYSTSLAEGNRVRFGANYSTSRATFIFGTQSNTLDILSWRDSIHTAVSDNTKLVVDDVVITEYSEVPHFALESTLFLFKGNDSNTRILVASIYDFAIYENNVLVKHYIPAYNKITHANGMYELVGSTFYPSASGVNFSQGTRKSTLQNGLTYKVLSENTFYTWYNKNWVNIGQLYTAGDGIAIDPDGTIHISSGSVITVDNETIIKQPNSSNITAIGVQTKSNDIMYDWIGTKAQWEAGRANHTIADNWICWITDDDQEVDAGVANLAQVASTGRYQDLVGRPTYTLPEIPSLLKNTDDLMLKWNHTTQQLEWVVIN